MKSTKQVFGILLAAVIIALLLVGAGRQSTLNGAWHIIRKKEFVDLTH